jgi:diguanylate cyclase (GGDEF)-like protein
LLKQIASRLTALIGPGGLVIRMGGDEFVLADASVRSRSEVEALAGRILEAVSAPYCVSGHDIVIGASVGVAVSQEHGRCTETLLSHSDNALYRAKVSRGGYVLADDTPAATPASQEKVVRRQAA